MYLVKKKEISLSSHNKGLWKKKLDKKLWRSCFQGWCPFDHSEKKNLLHHKLKMKGSFYHHLSQFHKCKGKSCSRVSSPEQDRLAKRSDDRFHHHWINESMKFCSKTGYNWLLYEEGQEMFCLLCRKHNVVKAKNKSNKFNIEPAVRIKKKAVEEHNNNNNNNNNNNI